VSEINHGRAWDQTQSQWLINAMNHYKNIATVTATLGRTHESIRCRIHKMLGLNGLFSDDDLVRRFTEEFRYEDRDMTNIPESKSPAKYRIVIGNKTKVCADTLEEAETAAGAYLRKNPCEDVFIFMAVKRLFVPTTVNSEDVP
jgi:hypothetical protein